MRKGTDLIGKPIIAFDTGKQIDRVEDLIFDQHTSQLLGFLVDEGGWRGTARVVPLGGVQAIGPDAVVVPSAVVVIDAARVPDIQQILERDNVLKGKKIYTTDGRYLGTMVDLYFDEATGRIEGYEASGGAYADPHTGRAFVPSPETFSIGDDVAFVPPEVALAMEERVGGDAGDVTRDLSSFVGATEAGRDMLVGRRTRRMVRTPTGLIVAAPGQIVTETTLARARELGREQELVAAVGVGPNADDVDDASRPQNLWERVKERMTGVAHRAPDAGEDPRIRRALGRPVTRAILDDADEVILGPGEIVTHGAVERARASGVLDMLLDSVEWDAGHRRVG